MAKYSSILLILLSLLLFSCKKEQPQFQTEDENQHLSEEEKAEQTLYDELMRIHDEVMPLTPALNRCQRQLKAELADNPDSVLIQSQIRDLKKANESMMTWMYTYNQDTPENFRAAGMSHREIMDSMKVIRAKIMQVDKDMRSALADGRELLETQLSAD